MVEAHVRAAADVEPEGPSRKLDVHLKDLLGRRDPLRVPRIDDDLSSASAAERPRCLTFQACRSETDVVDCSSS